MPRHTVLNAGAFCLPLLPFLIIQGRYENGPYSITPPDVAVLWLAGLAISYLLILVHELGHAFAGRSVGIEITSLTIGHWRRLASFQTGAVRVTLRAAPDSGYVTPKTSPQLLSGPRMFVFLSGDLLAEAGVLVPLLWLTGLPDKVFSFGDLLAAFSRTMALCLGGAHLLLTLYPRPIRIAGGLVPNDGMQLLNLWRHRRQLPELRRQFLEFEELNAFCDARRFGDALKAALPLAERHPDNIEMQNCLAALLLETGDTHQAEARLRELLKKPAGAEKLAEFLDRLACIALYHGRPDLRPEAEAWITEALRYAPGAITLKGTRGGLLIEAGRLDEGMPLLREVIKRSECLTDHAISAAYLAKAHASRNERAEALRWLKKAQASDARHRAVQQIAREIGRRAAPPGSRKQTSSLRRARSAYNPRRKSRAVASGWTAPRRLFPCRHDLRRLGRSPSSYPENRHGTPDHQRPGRVRILPKGAKGSGRHLLPPAARVHRRRRLSVRMKARSPHE